MDELEPVRTKRRKGGILTERQCFSRIGMAYFILTILTTVLQAIGVVIVAVTATDVETGSWQMWIATFLPMYGIAVPVCVTMMARVPHRAPKKKPLGISRFAAYFLMSIAILYLGNLIGSWMMYGLNLLRGTPVENEVETLLGHSSLWLNFLVTVLIAPSVEELLFRKLLIDRTRQFGEGLAVILSGILFGLFHGNLYQFFYACGLGMLFAYLYIRTGRLRYTIALHMLINFLGAVLTPLITAFSSRQDFADPFSILQYIPPMLWVTVYGLTLLGCAIAGGILLLINFHKVSLSAGECPLARGTRFKTIFGNVGMILFLLSIIGIFIYHFL